MSPVLLHSRTRLPGLVNSAIRIAAPTAIPDLMLWLNAGALTAANGEAIQTWNDSSGNGRDATQSNASLRPVYYTNVMNGLPVVRFTGQQGMSTGLTISAVPFTILCVYSPTGTNLGDSRAINGDGSGSDNWLLGIYTNFCMYDGSFVNGPTATGGTAVVAVARNHEYRHNNVSKGNSPSSQVPGVVWLGKNAVYQNTGECNIAEVCSYSRSLTDTEIGNLETYMMGKYAIS